ncbi:MAG: hypothetical protein AB7G15_14025 [Alphaproteobacteria bacterium]
MAPIAPSGVELSEASPLRSEIECLNNNDAELFGTHRDGIAALITGRKRSARSRVRVIVLMVSQHFAGPVIAMREASRPIDRANADDRAARIIDANILRHEIADNCPVQILFRTDRECAENDERHDECDCRPAHDSDSVVPE